MEFQNDPFLSSFALDNTEKTFDLDLDLDVFPAKERGKKRILKLFGESEDGGENKKWMILCVNKFKLQLIKTLQSNDAVCSFACLKGLLKIQR